MQIVNVEAKAGLVSITIEVGDRKVVALLGDESTTAVVWKLQAARAEAACQREKMRQEVE